MRRIRRRTDFEVWPELRQPLVEAYLKAHPMFAVFAGRHEYDGQLPDWSAEGIASEIRRLHAFRDRALAVPDASLAEDARFERDNFVARIDRDLFWLETAEAPFTNPAFYLDWMLDNLDPSPYLTRDYAPLPTRMRAYTKYAKAIPAAAGQIRANLRAPLALPLLERGISAFAGFADFFEKDVAATFASVTDPALQSELADANRSAAAAMRELASWLESQRASATGDFALGARAVRQDAARHRGRDDFPRRSRGGRPCRSRAEPSGAERSVRAITCRARRFRTASPVRKPTNRKAARLLGARAQLAELKAFVQQAGVATIPGTEEALVAESPPYNRANFAYIDIPGPYEKGLPSIYYISPPDPSWTAQEQSDYLPGKADLLFTSVHEVWPGHFLQYLHANRNPSIVSRLFVGYAYAEGWAHYAEEMMWEMGLGEAIPRRTSVSSRTRCCATCGSSRPSACTRKDDRRRVRANVPSSRHSPTSAPRGSNRRAAPTIPAYLNYTMGKLMIRKLRDDWTATRGGRSSVARVPRSIPVVRRPADPDGETADARRRRGGAFLTFVT